MKYCCNKFEEASQRDRRSSPNIRIVKFVRQLRTTFKLGENNYITIPDEPGRTGPFRFFMTTGYAVFNFENPSFNINFCPFCGVDLFRFYSDVGDVKPNETEDETFRMAPPL